MCFASQHVVAWVRGGVGAWGHIRPDRGRAGAGNWKLETADRALNLCRGSHLKPVGTVHTEVSTSLMGGQSICDVG